MSTNASKISREVLQRDDFSDLGNERVGKVFFALMLLDFVKCEKA